MRPLLLAVFLTAVLLHKASGYANCSREMSKVGCHCYKLPLQLICNNVDDKCLQSMSRVLKKVPSCYEPIIIVNGRSGADLNVTNATFTGFDKVHLLRLIWPHSKVNFATRKPFVALKNVRIFSMWLRKEDIVWKELFTGLEATVEMRLRGITFEDTSATFTNLSYLNQLTLNGFGNKELALNLSMRTLAHLWITCDINIQWLKSRSQPLELKKGFVTCQKDCEILDLGFDGCNITHADPSPMLVNTHLKAFKISSCAIKDAAFRNMTLGLNNSADVVILEEMVEAEGKVTGFPTFYVNQICDNVHGMKKLSLDRLHSQVNSVPSGAFARCSKIRDLSLFAWYAGMAIIFHPLALHGLLNMQKLEMTNMHLGDLPQDALSRIPHLKILDLSNTVVAIDRSLPSIRSFHHILPNLEEVDISYVSHYWAPSNQVQQIADMFTHQTKLKVLKARGYCRGNINSGIFLDFSKNWFPQNLEKVDFSDTPSLFDFRIYSNSHLLDPKKVFGGMKKLKKIDISKTRFGMDLDSYYPMIFEPVAENLEELIIVDASLIRFHNRIPAMRNLKILNLTGNRISDLQFSSENNQGFPVLQCLGLSNNGLHHVSKGTIGTLSSMENSLSVVTLEYNPFDCSCALLPLADWLRTLLRRNHSIGWNTKPMCDEKKLVSVYYINILLCNENWLYLTLLILLVTSPPLSSLVYIYRWKIRLLWLLFRVKHSGAAGLDAPVRTVYVAYHDKDQWWVLNHLLPKLENDSTRQYEEAATATEQTALLPRDRDTSLTFEQKLSEAAEFLGVKLFLKNRQMVLGVEAEEIIKAINASEIVLLLASKNFFGDNACLFPIQVANHEMIKTVRSKLAVVFLEEIDERHCPHWLQFPIPLLRRLLPCFEYYKVEKNQKRVEEFWIKLLFVCAGKKVVKNEFSI